MILLKMLYRIFTNGTKSILGSLTLFRFRSCVFHIDYWLNTRKNTSGFMSAIKTELFCCIADKVKKQRYCPLCGWQGYLFSPVCFGDNYREDSRCPSCMTLERHRVLSLFIKEQNISTGKCLVIGPNKLFCEKVFRNYTSLDVNSNNNPDVVGDVTHLPFSDKSFNTVTCFRVLEHVPLVDSALSEINRVLDLNGVAYISVPMYV